MKKYIHSHVNPCTGANYVIKLCKSRKHCNINCEEIRKNTTVPILNWFVSVSIAKRTNDLEDQHKHETANDQLTDEELHSLQVSGPGRLHERRPPALA